MKKPTIQKGQKIGQLLNLSQKIAKLPDLSLVEKEVLESEHRFESVFYSNKLEGNKLSKIEARRAIQ